MPRTCERRRRDANHLVSLVIVTTVPTTRTRRFAASASPSITTRAAPSSSPAEDGAPTARGAHAERAPYKPLTGLAHQHLCRRRQSHALNERRRRGHVGERCLRRSQNGESTADTVPASSRPLLGRCDNSRPTGLPDAEAAQQDRVDDGIHHHRDRDANRERSREDSEERCGRSRLRASLMSLTTGGSVASRVAQGHKWNSFGQPDPARRTNANDCRDGRDGDPRPCSGRYTSMLPIPMSSQSGRRAQREHENQDPVRKRCWSPRQSAPPPLG